MHVGEPTPRGIPHAPPPGEGLPPYPTPEAEIPNTPRIRTYGLPLHLETARTREESTNYLITDRGIDVVANGTSNVLSGYVATAFTAFITEKRAELAEALNSQNDLRTILNLGVRFTNDFIRVSKNQLPEDHEQGQTSMTAAVKLSDRSYAIVHIGDGGALVVRKGGQIEPLTKQHIRDRSALSEELKRDDLLRAEKVRINQAIRKNSQEKFEAGRLLSASIDGSPDVQADISFVTLEDGDILSLYTNDVIGNHPDERISPDEIGAAIINSRHKKKLADIATIVGTLRETPNPEDRMVIIKRVGEMKHFPNRAVRRMSRNALNAFRKMKGSKDSHGSHGEHHGDDHGHEPHAGHHEDDEHNKNSENDDDHHRGADENIPMHQYRHPNTTDPDPTDRFDHRTPAREIPHDLPTEELPSPAANEEPSTSWFNTWPVEPDVPADDTPTQQFPIPAQQDPTSEAPAPASGNRNNTLRYVTTAAAGIVIAGITAELVRRRKNRRR